MRNLAAAHRPRRLEDVIGQPDVVAAVGDYIKSGSNQTLLFAGPPGTGKTTMARIIAAQRTCVKPDAPCGECGDCRGIFAGDGTFGYTEMDAARFNEAHYAKERADRITTSSLTFWVTFIDEAHRLDRAAQDVLLKAAEEPHPRALFIMATSEPDGLKPALRNRCLAIHFRRIRAVECQRLLADTCRKEGIAFDHVALDMLSVAADGSARVALNLLDQAEESGQVTGDLAAKSLAFGDVAPLLRFFEAVVANDAARQDEALDDWAEEPLVIARMIRDFLLYLYNFEVSPVRRSDIVNPAFFRIGARDREPIVAGFRRLANGQSFEEFWLGMLDLWEINPQTLVDRPSLWIKVNRYLRVLSASTNARLGPSLPKVQADERVQPKRSFRTRSSRKPVASAAERQARRYLSQSQAEDIYEAATFLAQEHGLLFNTHLYLNHGSLGLPDEAGAGALVSDLTHQLSIRVRTWTNGATAHWIYVHRAGSRGIETNIALSLPPRALDHVDGWLTKWMGSRSGVTRRGWSLDASSSARAGGWQTNRVQRHWFIVRKLWGGIDPDILEWNEERRRVPLLDLLRVRKEDRTPIGELHQLRAVGSSRSLGPDRRQGAEASRMGLLSALKDDAWKAMFSGWELDEFRDRLAERVRRQEARERIDLEYPVSSNALEARAREFAFDNLESSWPIDPKSRLRSWKGWWA